MDGTNPLYAISIPDASKDGEVVKFTIQTKTDDNKGSEGGVIVIRQYEDFEYLLHGLTTRNDVSGVVIPPLPPKPIATPAATERKTRLKQPGNINTMAGDEYYQDCRRFEVFLQSLTGHKAFQKDEILKSFLLEQEAPARAAVKRGLIDSLFQIVDSARFQGHKDLDDDFQKRRDLVNSLVINSRACSSSYIAVTRTENGLDCHLAAFASACRTASATEADSSGILARLLSQFADVLDQYVVKSQKAINCGEETLGFSLELYSRYLTACQEMLFRRTCKMIDFENAMKALEKAKPKNQEQLEKEKDAAQHNYDEISVRVKEEYELFNEQRIRHFTQSLCDLADAKVAAHRDACDVLSQALADVKSIS